MNDQTKALIRRAQSASNVYEEADVVQNAVAELAKDQSALTEICKMVRACRADRACLLGVVAALVPEGVSFFASGSFSADHGCAIAKAGPKDAQARDIPWVQHQSAALALLIAILEAQP